MSEVGAYDAGYRQGLRDCEVRIIALLETTKILTTIEQGVLVNYAEDAIALIKGETE